jgi:PKD repeat protein
MKNIISLLLSLAIFLPGYSFAASQDIHIEWSYAYQPVEGRTLTGYYLYKEGVKVCTSNSPASSVMDCVFDSEDGTFNFTLTAFCSDGSESPHSPSYSFTLVSQPPPPPAPVASITPGTFSGVAPVTILFDGSSSTNAVSYNWTFGDGDTASGSTLGHIFSTAGTYTTTLTVSNSAGTTDSATVTVSVSEAVVQNTPPTAILSSSTAIGDAPLVITFNGSASHDAEGPISSYLWGFGDGSQTSTTSNTISHTYTTPGTYSAFLTVIDNQGDSNTISTPAIVTTPTTENENPLAGFTVSTSQGPAPLSVTFDGSSSSDPEGGPLSYSWNLGDGNTAQGVSTSHIYTSPGSFVATLTVTDDQGATASTTTAITANLVTPPFQIELGEVEIDHNWVHIDFDNTFIAPIVVSGPPSQNDSDPAVIRMRNISATGFDIRLQEWDYQDDVHGKETVAYLVLERGNHTLDDGTMIEVGTFTSTDTSFQTVQFDTTFSTEPVLMTSIATFNEAETITSRLRNISTTSFAHKPQGQEASTSSHASETINYIAWEPSRNKINNINVIVGKTADKVRHRWYTVNFGEELTDLPVFLGTMQSHDGKDTSAIRYADKTYTAVQVMVEEEQSKDDETRHTSEVFGYFLFSENSDLSLEITNLLPTNYTTTSSSIGDNIFSDRSYIITELPLELLNNITIKTKMDDKYNNSSSFITFNINKPATLIIGYDPRANPPPAWLSQNYNKIAPTVGINALSPTYLTLWKKTIEPGLINIPGNLYGDPQLVGTNYSVFLIQQQL